MPRPPSFAPDVPEKVLDYWSEKKLGPEIAEIVGVPAHIVRGIVRRARQHGDPRAVIRNLGAARRPEPVRYSSSKAYLDAALKRVAERRAAWEQTELSRRMEKIAVPPKHPGDISN